jgi:hypothetical protein
MLERCRRRSDVELGNERLDHLDEHDAGARRAARERQRRTQGGFGFGRSVQPDNDATKPGRQNRLARPKQQHRGRAPAQQLVCGAAEPEAADPTAPVRGHDHEVEVVLVHVLGHGRGWPF